MTTPATDPAHRHGGPDAGWYRPGPDGWQRITDAEAANERHADMAHFMSDPNGRHGYGPAHRKQRAQVVADHEGLTR